MRLGFTTCELAVYFDDGEEHLAKDGQHYIPVLGPKRLMLIPAEQEHKESRRAYYQKTNSQRVWRLSYDSNHQAHRQLMKTGEEYWASSYVDWEKLSDNSISITCPPKPEHRKKYRKRTYGKDAGKVPAEPSWSDALRVMQTIRDHSEIGDRIVVYEDGWSDSRVAINTGVPEVTVRMIREEELGALPEPKKMDDPEDLDIRESLAEIHRKLDTILNDLGIECAGRRT